MSLFDVGVDTSVLFVWVFRGDDILESFGVAGVFVFATKKVAAVSFACAAAADFKSAASFSSFSRLVFALALAAAAFLALLFLLGLGILGSRDAFCCLCF